MKIIICGAHDISHFIALNLVKTGAQVTIIDEDQAKLRYFSSSLAVKTIVGKASHPNILNKAGAKHCDMLIALNNSDEENIVTCQMALNLFAIPLKVALINHKT